MSDRALKAAALVEVNLNILEAARDSVSNEQEWEWPRRLTAWLLTPLPAWAVFWTWPTADGKGSWWAFGIALVCVATAAAVVRI